MSNRTGDWYSWPAKSEAVWRVLRYLAAHPEEGRACIGNDLLTHAFFTDKGRIDIPVEEGARVIFLKPGTSEQGPPDKPELGNPVILQMPAGPIQNPTDDELMKLMKPGYTYWKPPGR